MLYQRTLLKPLRFRGVGLHTGNIVEIEVLPADPDHGIVFLRTDLKDAQAIKACPAAVGATDLNTTIGHGENSISTIEHLMSAFHGLGIDNALIKINAPEIPILDGSAAPFVDFLLITGSKRQGTLKKSYRVTQPFEVKHNDSFMRIEPHKKDELHFTCTINFQYSKAIGKQSFDFLLNENNFFSLCEARTFCHIKDVEYMRSRGLARGGSLDNAIVVDDEKVLNAEGLRYDNEFVRHKLLDCVGDLKLLGFQLFGKITLYKAGHFLHAKFMRQFLENFSLYADEVLMKKNFDIPQPVALKTPII